MWLANVLGRLFGITNSTFLYKIDLGNSFKRIRVKKETDQFIRFKDHGTDYIVLKTVPPKIDPRGNRQFFMFETDVHVFDPNTGQVLAEEMEKEFKKRLLQNELEEFKDLMKEVQSDALKKKAGELYDGMELSITKKGDDTKIDEVDKDDLYYIDITVPTIKLGKTRQIEIDALTPHDTINEVMSMILDGTILSSLIKPRRWNKWEVVGILIVGICAGWMLVIMYAVSFPDQWQALVGGMGAPDPVDTIGALLQ